MKVDYKKLQLPEPIEIGLMRGDDRDFIFDVYDSTGIAVAITGATITFTVRTAIDGSSVFSKTVGSGITISGTVTNRMTVAVDPADTSSQDPGIYRYDVQLVLSGYTVTVAHGPFAIVGEVS